MNGFLTVGEAALTLGISDRAVRKRIAHGHLRAEHAGPRVLLIPVAEVERARAEPPKPGRQAKAPT